MNNAILRNSEVAIFDKNNNFATARVSCFFQPARSGTDFFFTSALWFLQFSQSWRVQSCSINFSIDPAFWALYLNKYYKFVFIFIFFLLRYTCRVIFVAMEQVCCVYCHPSYSTCHPCTSYIITPLLLGSSSQTSNYLAT